MYLVVCEWIPKICLLESQVNPSTVGKDQFFWLKNGKEASWGGNFFYWMTSCAYQSHIQQVSVANIYANYVRFLMKAGVSNHFKLSRMFYLTSQDVRNTVRIRHKDPAMALHALVTSENVSFIAYKPQNWSVNTVESNKFLPQINEVHCWMEVLREHSFLLVLRSPDLEYILSISDHVALDATHSICDVRAWIVIGGSYENFTVSLLSI